MKPKNKVQQQIVKWSATLPPINEQQKHWGSQHCFKHRAHHTKKGMTTCMECGHVWKQKISDTLTTCVCPQCGTKLMIDRTRHRVFTDYDYYGIQTTHGGFQVIRFFYVKVECKVGMPAQYRIYEVVQHWIAANGSHAVMARRRPPFAYYRYDTWSFDSDLEIRANLKLYNIIPTQVYPRQHIIPRLRQRGFNGAFHGVTPFELFRVLLTNNKAETLWKTKRYDLLRQFIRKDKLPLLEKYWPSLLVCLRHNYAISEVSIWCDYIGELLELGKDTHNPKYICPEDIHTMHALYSRILAERRKLAEALQQQQEYRKQKGRFFDIRFSDGKIDVRVLDSVEEVYQEGKALRHCVFSSRYYERTNSLLLSARLGNERLETIEVSLESLKILQCRGLKNEDSPHHRRIIKLVNNNMNLIRERRAA